MEYLDNRKSFFEAVSEKVNIGSYDEFLKKIESPDNRKNLFDALSESYNIGTFEEYESKLGFSKQDTPIQATPNQNSYVLRQDKPANKFAELFRNPHQENYFKDISDREAREKEKISYVIDPYQDDDLTQFTPKKEQTYQDIMINQSELFKATPKGQEAYSKLMEKQTSVLGKYIDKYKNTPEYRRHVENYQKEYSTAVGDEQKATIDKKYNALLEGRLHSLYGTEMNTELEPAMGEYHNALYETRQTSIDGATQRLGRTYTQAKLPEIKQSINDALSEHQNSPEYKKARDEEFKRQEIAAMFKPELAHTTFATTELNLSLNPVMRQLNAAKKRIEKSEDMIEAALQGKGLGAGFIDQAKRINNWTYGFNDFIENSDVRQVIEKAEKDENSLTKSEKALLDAVALEACAIQYFSYQLSRGYKAGTTTAASVPFMIEFMVNPLSGAGRALAKTLGGWAIKRGITGFGLKSLTFGSRMLGDMLGAAGMTATSSIGRVASGVEERMIGNVGSYADVEGVHFAGREGEQTFGEAVRNSVADNLVENYSEMFFGAFEGGSKAIRSFLKSSPLKGLPKTKVFEIAKNLFSSYDKLQRAVQFHGYLGEVSEEYIGNLLRLGVTTDTEASDVFNEDAQIDTWLGLLPTSVAFGIIGVSGRGINKYSRYKDTHRMNYDRFKASLSSQELTSFENVEAHINAGDTEFTKNYIKETLHNKELNDAQKIERLNAVYGAMYDKNYDDFREVEIASIEERLHNNHYNKNTNGIMTVATDKKSGNIVFVTGAADNGELIVEGIDGKQETVPADRLEDMKSVDYYSTLKSIAEGEFARRRVERLYKEGDEVQDKDGNNFTVSQLSDNGVIIKNSEGEEAEVPFMYFDDNFTSKAEVDIDKADAEIDKQTNSTNGRVTNVKIGGKEGVFYIKAGNLVAYKDDNDNVIIDKEHSDETFVVVDAETGEAKQVGINQIDEVLGDAAPIELKEQSHDEIRNAAENKNTFPVGALVYNEEMPNVFTTVIDNGGYGFSIATVNEKTGRLENVPISNDAKEGWKTLNLSEGNVLQTNLSKFEIISNEGNGNLIVSIDGGEAVRMGTAELSERLQYEGFNLSSYIENESKKAEQKEQTPEQLQKEQTPEQLQEEEDDQYSDADLYATVKALYKKREKQEKIANNPIDLTDQKAIKARETAKKNVELLTEELAKWQAIINKRDERKKAEREKQNAISEERRAAIEAERIKQKELERIEREKAQGVPDVSVDNAEDARKRGYRIETGRMVERQQPQYGLIGNEREVVFSSKDKVTGKYKVVEAETLQESHINGKRNTKFFLTEAQPKERTDKASQMAAQKIAENLNPTQITEGTTAYVGTPITNTRGEIIQGNNRTSALKYMYSQAPEKSAEYKQFLIDNADSFGLNSEEIAAMKNPVLVTEIDVTDEEAIRLGQKNAQDTESGGIQRIDSEKTAKSLGDGLYQFTSRLMQSNDEEQSLSSTIEQNGRDALKILLSKNLINETQYQSAFDDKGALTQEAKEDLVGIVEGIVFANSKNDNIKTMFNSSPQAAKKAILQTVARDAFNSEDVKVVPYIQEAIEIYYSLSLDTVFASAKTIEDVRKAAWSWSIQSQTDFVGNLFFPSQRYTNFALELAVMFKSQTMATQRAKFNELYDKLQGVGGDMFSETELLPFRDAVEKVYNVKLNKELGHVTNDGSHVLADGSELSEERERGGTRGTRGDEQATLGAEPADNRAGVEGDNRQGTSNRQTKEEKDEKSAISEEPKSVEPAISSEEKTQPTQPANKIEDVGEKIGGAKKDLAKSYAHVSTDDIVSQPLSKLFPRPDYAKLIESGQLTQDGAIIIEYLYSKLTAKPRKSNRVNRWAKTVEELISTYEMLIESTKNGNGEEFSAELAKTLADKNHWSGRKFDTYYQTMKTIGFPQSGVKLGKYDIREFSRGADKSVFSILNGNVILKEFNTLEEAALALKDILLNPNTKAKKYTKFNVYQDIKTKEYFIGKKGASGTVRVVEGFKTAKEAFDHRETKKDEVQAIWDAMQEVQDERRDVNKARVGEDWRNGKDVGAEEFRDAFGFRGVEFGNWVNQTERQANVNAAYDALMDMATILGVSPQALSLNGELGFAFGSRGSGKAMAHYEPSKIVINLTKTKGAGSLAHEWWHAMDNYFSRKRGLDSEFVTANPRQLISNSGKDTSVRTEMLEAFNNVVKAINESELNKRSRKLDATRTKPYWSTVIETTARSFESYIADQLAENVQSNDFLVNFKTTEEWARDGLVDVNKNYPYPLLEEKHAINEAFQQFFDTVQEKVDEETGNTTLFKAIWHGISQEEMSEKRAIAEGVTKKLNIDIEFVENPDELPDSEIKARRAIQEGEKVGGWYNPKTNKAYLYIPNVTTANEVEKTILHEVVAHKGLRGLLGKEQFNALCDSVWQQMTGKERLYWTEYVLGVKTGQAHPLDIARAIGSQANRRAAADEFMANMAENGIENKTAWQKIVEFVKDALRKMGFGKAFTDRELIEKDIKKLLSKSYKRQTRNKENSITNEKESDVRFRFVDNTEYIKDDLEEEKNKYGGKRYKIVGDDIIVSTYFVVENSDQYSEIRYASASFDKALDYAKDYYDNDIDSDYVTIDLESIERAIPISEFKENNEEIWGNSFNEFEGSLENYIDTYIDDYLDNAGVDVGYETDEEPVRFVIQKGERDNKYTDKLIWDVEDEIERRFGVKVGKYSSFYVNREGNITDAYEDEQGRENLSVTMRISDHTHNPANGKDDLNVLIADKDATSRRFFTSTEDLVFNSDYTADEIVDEIEEYWRNYARDNYNGDELDIRFRTTAYHGSPHEVDKFSTDYIGTGEGAQAFGWGLYFTSIKDIAKEYATMRKGGVGKNLPVIDNINRALKERGIKEYDKYSLIDFADALIENEGDFQKTLNQLEKWAKHDNTGELQELFDDISLLDAEVGNNLLGEANLYSVTIHKDKTPDQYTWLEWDKPVTERQKEAVRRVFDEITNNEPDYHKASELSNQFAKYDFEGKTGEDIYREISDALWSDKYKPKGDSDKRASLLLLKNGIDGIKYPAESIARGTTSDNARGFNYVVFDENAVSIDEHIRFRIGNKRKADMKAGLLNKLTNATEEQVERTISEIEKLGEDVKAGGDSKTEKVAYHWALKGTVILPEDNDKILQAIKVAEISKVNPMEYNSPMELINNHDHIKLKEKPIDPDTVHTLTNKKDLGNGITIYNVEESEDSRENMRKIINTHLGNKRSPWCLLQGDENGNLTEQSAKYWKYYNGIPKRVAFYEGRLIAFSANDSNNVVWWDKQDKPTKGIPITHKIPNDELERTGTTEYNEETGLYGEYSNIHRGNKENGLYEAWHDNGQMFMRTTFKDGKMKGLREEWYNNGKLYSRTTYKDGERNGLYEEWHNNGQMRLRATYKDGKENGLSEEWYYNGQIKTRAIYKDGERKLLPTDVSLQELVDRGELDKKYLYDENEGEGVLFRRENANKQSSESKTLEEYKSKFENPKDIITFALEENTISYGSKQKANETLRETVRNITETGKLRDDSGRKYILHDNNAQSGSKEPDSVIKKVTKRTVLKDFKESGFVEFAGTKIESPQDIADLFSIHRSPNIEKFHLIFVDDKGVILGTHAYTINLSNQALLPNQDVISDTYRKYNASGVYFLHNHPSGNQKVSIQDVASTDFMYKKLAEEGQNLIGHVVIDTDKFSYINISEKAYKGENYNQSLLSNYINEQVEEYEYKNAQAKLFSEREFIGSGKEAPKRLLEISKALLTANSSKGTIVYLTANLDVAAYDVFPDSAKESDIIKIAEQGYKNNLGSRIAFVHDGSYSFPLRMPHFTLDVIDIHRGSMEFVTENIETPTINQLWESQSEYRKGSKELEAIAKEIQSLKDKAIADGTFMKAPNGNPTNLNERQWLQVRTKNFKYWFGDWENDPENASKVVNEDGTPKVVYHGTNSDFTTFDTQRFNTRENSGDYVGEGFFFADKESTAKKYGSNVMPVYLNLRNPLIINTEQDGENFRSTFLNMYQKGDKELRDLIGGDYDYFSIMEENPSAIRQELQRRGYDGLIDNLYGQYAVFNPNQIKSATDNVGTFDRNNDDIRFQKIPEPATPSSITDAIKPDESIIEYAKRQQAMFDGYSEERQQQIRDAVSDNMEKGGKLINRIYKNAFDANQPLERLQKNIQKQGGMVVNGVSDAYNDHFRSLGRATTAYDEFHSGVFSKFKNNLQSLSTKQLPTNIRWADKKNMTQIDKITLYLRAKDMVEAKSLGLPNRGEEGFAENVRRDNSYMTKVTPEEYVEEFERAVGTEDINLLWENVQEVNQWTLNYMEKNNFTDESIKEKYNRKYYVPQRGFEEGEAVSQRTRGRESNSNFNPALRKAKGRKSLSESPLAHMAQIAQSTIMQVEKNNTKRQFLNFCIANMRLGRVTGEFSVDKVHYKKTGRILENGLPEYEEVYGIIPYKELEQDAENRRELRRVKAELAKEGLGESERSLLEKRAKQLSDAIIYEANVRLDQIRPQTMDNLEEHRVEVLYKGKRYSIFVNDVEVANALNRKDGEMGKWMKFFSTNLPFVPMITKYFSRILTQQNPSFALWNLLRDTGMGYMTNIVEHPNWVPTFTKNLTRTQSTIADYAFRGKLSEGKMGDYLKEFFAEGAQTGFSFINRMEDLKRKIERELNIDNTLADKILEGGNSVLQFFSNITEWSELAVRFSQYVTAREHGMTPAQAATEAKEVSVNFDRKGKLRLFYGLFSFFNATMQGTNKMIRQWNKGYKTGLALYFSAHVASGVLNTLLMPDDPEDEKGYSEYDRMTNIVIGSWRIPLPQGLRAFHAIGVQIALAMQGQKTLQAAIMDALSFVFGEWLPINPIDGFYIDPSTNRLRYRADLGFRSFVPTFATPIYDVVTNTTYSGGTVHREPFVKTLDVPATMLSKKGVNGTLQELTDKLFELGGGNLTRKTMMRSDGTRVSELYNWNPSDIEFLTKAFTGGVGQFAMDMFDTGYNIVTGNVNSFDDFAATMPVVKRAYKPYKEETSFNSAYYELLGKIKAAKESYNTLPKERRQIFDRAVSVMSSVDVNNPTKANLKSINNVLEDWNINYW